MRDTDYAYAVARIRVNELGLLTKNDLETLIAADSYSTAVRILTDKGWSEPDDKAFDICEAELSKAWKLLEECLPDYTLFEAMVIGNDFSNLKAAIKAYFSKLDGAMYMTVPCLCSTDLIIKSVKEGNFTNLPDYLRDCADSAYHAYTENQSGQLAEMIIDKASNKAKIEFAAKSESKLLEDIFAIAVAMSDIKTARRCVSTGKTEEFALDAVSGAGKLDSQKLVSAAFAKESLEELVKESGLPEIAEYADGDFTALEMKCDNLITDLIKGCKYDIFGPDPAVAYYYAKIAEVKNVRIILSAKQSGVPTDAIRERVREIYV